MVRAFFLFVIIASGMVLNTGCMGPKISIKLNDIDSVIRKVNPDHNCGCDYKNKSISLPSSNNGKRNVYYWQNVYLKNYTSSELPLLAKKTKAELIRLVPELEHYRRFYIEFRKNTTAVADTVFKSENIGVAYFIKGKCDGFKASVTAKEMIKKSHNKKYEAALCK